ncbi:MAG: hypothetical protein QXZ44_02080 [Ferroplasma sp.]
MSDYIHELKYLEEDKISVELSYRLNYDKEKACGSVRIYSGKIDPEADNYEVYMEIFECGLSKEEVYQRRDKIISEIRDGKIDISL